MFMVGVLGTPGTVAQIYHLTSVTPVTGQPAPQLKLVSQDRSPRVGDIFQNNSGYC